MPFKLKLIKELQKNISESRFFPSQDHPPNQEDNPSIVLHPKSVSSKKGRKAKKK